MADTQRFSASGTGLQSWETFVTDQLPHIWSEAAEHSGDDDSGAVTEVVLLRMLEWTDREHEFRDLGQLLDTIVGSVVHEESERARRRLVWRRRHQAGSANGEEPAREGPS